MFYGLAIPKANEVHVSLLHRAPGRRHAHQWPFMGAAHRQAPSDDVSLGDQLLDGEVQIREGRAQHGGQYSHRLGAAISSRRSLVVYEVGGDELAGDGEIPAV